MLHICTGQVILRLAYVAFLAIFSALKWTLFTLRSPTRESSFEELRRRTFGKSIQAPPPNVLASHIMYNYSLQFV